VHRLQRVPSIFASPIFDLTGDGVVDSDDVNNWLAKAASKNGFGSPYLKGDTNLDLRQAKVCLLNS
jgi:hypothetical protein